MSGIKNTPSDDSYVELSTTSSQSSGNGNGSLLRALTIASTSGLEVQIPVPSQPFDAWIVADVLREEFQRSLAASPEATDALEVQEEQENAAGAAEKAASEAKINLAAKFLGFLASRASVKTSSHELNLLHHAWAHFHEEFLAEHGSVHDLVAAIDTDLRSSVLRSYFEAYVQLETAGKAKPSLVTPKLFSLSADNKAELHAVFGGQGNNEVSTFLSILLSCGFHSLPSTPPTTKIASLALASCSRSIFRAVIIIGPSSCGFSDFHFFFLDLVFRGDAWRNSEGSADTAADSTTNVAVAEDGPHA